MATANASVRKELEFDKIVDLLMGFSQSPRNKNYFKNIQPLHSYSNLQGLMACLEEYMIFRGDQSAPGFQYHSLDRSVKMLNIQGSVLEPLDIFAIYYAVDFSNRSLKYFSDNARPFAALKSLYIGLRSEKEILKWIDQVFDQKKNIRSSASENLSEIRQQLLSRRKQNDRAFNMALSSYSNSGYLADTRETFVNEIRLLSVLSEHKRKVEGYVRGSSKTGSITYIEPQTNVLINQEIFRLMEEEKAEIRKILMALSNQLREKSELIFEYRKQQEELDRLEAKTKLAQLTHSVRPKLSKIQKASIRDAYHPILVLSNEEKNKKIEPQDYSFEENQRIIVISGPNAGGKSISLKTMGLLQLMVQSGLFVPVHPDSSFFLFKTFFTDIGDNQSIENELSTYSYRLSRMREILEQADQNSFVLIDEFGSGSDPILGGALAAVFFKNIYESKTFGVLTTHYGNIKLMAEEMESASNASMLFDEKRLKPLYKLSVGRPGSSYTFEVAHNMGIPSDLIKDAKEKVSVENIRYEELINQYQRLNTSLEVEKKNLRKKTKRTHELKKSFDKKLETLDLKEKKLQDAWEDNQKAMSLGRKMEKYVQQYTKGRKKKDILAQFKKMLEIESATFMEEDARPKKKKTVFKERKHSIDFKVGDQVRLVDGRDLGEIIEIKKNMVTVIFGMIRTTLSISKIEKVVKKIK